MDMQGRYRDEVKSKTDVIHEENGKADGRGGGGGSYMNRSN